MFKPVSKGRVLALAPLVLTLGVPPAFAQIEEIVVTAQRRAESLQDVPISVSAFDAEAIEAKQITGFTDLQLHVPNVSFSKTNFSGTNFQIRGIGTLLTATSGDSGVAMHVNDVYINSPRIFETEYYDMQQIEILRGPQGTLFGRNATGGVVNMKTNRPVVGEFQADVEAQYGNFDHGKIKGAVNIPLGETMAARFAGIATQRDGYTDNVLTGNDVDDREQYSVRGSFRWEIGDNTTFDLIAHYFDEDSSRSRSQKQLCVQDPSPILGCLPTGTATQSLNPFATAGTLLSSDLVLGDLGLFAYFDTPLEDLNPNDMRKVRMALEPEYEADETFVMTEISHDFNDWLNVNFNAAYQDTSVLSRADYNGSAPNDGSVVLPAGFCAETPATCTFFGLEDGGPVWESVVNNPKTSLGAIAGGNEFNLSSQGGANDISYSESEQWSTEIRFSTSFDGPWNFMLAGSYMDFENYGGYNVKGVVLDYPATMLVPQGGNPDTFVTLAPGFFDSTGDDPRYELESYAMFGEAYWQATETVKFTVGLRYTNDEKDITDRQVFLNFPAVTDVNTGVTTVAGTPVTGIRDAVQAAAAAGLYDADPNVDGAQAWREDSVDFDEWTGRFVVDWTPDFAFTDETLIYASYSKGYKGGGINPPIDTTLFPNTPETFDSEEIDAWEIGTKNSLWDNRLQANLNMFFYDYGDLQIGKIINRTSLNENTDAEIFGFEGEFIVAPTESWLLNASLSYLDTELDDTETIDPRDPTQGRQDVTLYKDFLSAANCVVEWNGNGPASANEGFVEAVQNSAPYIPTGVDLGEGLVIPSTPGVQDSAVSACTAIAANAADFGYGYLDSVGTNLDGNELLAAPEWTVSLGAQYTYFFGNGMSLMGRVDYYWQDEFYSTTFNRPQDLQDSWDVVNAMATLTSANGNWFVRVWGKNLEDEDNITGTYETDPSSGLFTNTFLIEPQTYGVTVGMSL
jgi:outer membrane receptor protein involved in Fe transport